MPDTNLIQMGHIRGAHGIRGTCIIHSDCRPADHIGHYSSWIIGTSVTSNQPFTVTRCWQHGKQLLASIAGITDRDQALAMRGLGIFTSREQLAADIDAEDYLWHDLVGCEAFDQQKTPLGTITRLENHGATDILVIQSKQNSGEWMIPFTEEIIHQVDLTSHRIWLTLPDGMDACFTPKS
ncbi:MAG: ribosome maturation factor RimM [Mariprofundales bacterium]|nr:ribosome maturation factor RimM [Mariprofundales bacterium]